MKITLIAKLIIVGWILSTVYWIVEFIFRGGTFPTLQVALGVFWIAYVIYVSRRKNTKVK